MMKYKGAFIKLFPLMLKKHMIEQYGLPDNGTFSRSASQRTNIGYRW